MLGPSRRKFLLQSMALAAPFIITTPLLAQSVDKSLASVKNNVSAFKMQRWEEHFDNLTNGAILADLQSRAMFFWPEHDLKLRVYPIATPRDESLTRKGVTKIVRMRENPTWTPTASMHERFPDLPKVVPGGSPDNPLGTRAMYLTWPAYLIHGTHDTRKIGRKSSDGCVGLFNEHVEEVYNLVKVGTQVKLI